MSDGDCEVRLTCLSLPQLLMVLKPELIALLLQRFGEDLDADCQLSAEGARDLWEVTARCAKYHRGK